MTTDSGGEEHDVNDGEPTSTNGAIADGGDSAGGGGGGRGGGGRDYDNVSREEGGVRGGMRWLVITTAPTAKSSVFETYVMVKYDQTQHLHQASILSNSSDSAYLKHTAHYYVTLPVRSNFIPQPSHMTYTLTSLWKIHTP
jgi:hypothetical protein